MTSSSHYSDAHHWRMRAEEARAFADELKHHAQDRHYYDTLVEWAETNSTPWWVKKLGGSK
jgi:hypothetical protein